MSKILVSFIIIALKVHRIRISGYHGMGPFILNALVCSISATKAQRHKEGAWIIKLYQKEKDQYLKTLHPAHTVY